jgi:hypothetical protein
MIPSIFPQNWSIILKFSILDCKQYMRREQYSSLGNRLDTHRYNLAEIEDLIKHHGLITLFS